MGRYTVLILLLLFGYQMLTAQPAELPEACGMTISDHQGNVYQTVRIGTQCWMAENMRCTTSPTGKSWAQNPSYSFTEPMFASYYAVPKDNRYGLLYNWSSAMDLGVNECFAHTSSIRHRGICPRGWHLPSSHEWNVLLKHLGGTREAGAVMKGGARMWRAPLVIKSDENGFSALPAGLYTENRMQDVGASAFFWSSSAYDELHAWQCGVFNHNSDSYNCMEYKCYGCSVRCVKD